jgi:hypothetical protein
MIRKPSVDWQQVNEGAAVRTVRTAAAFGKSGARAARYSGYAARGLICYFFAGLWAFAAIVSGLAAGGLPMLIGIGAMAALMFWAGRRAFAKAREASG